MKQFSDEQLMIEFQAGNQKAFEILVKRYEKELYNFLLKTLGRPSLAQEVFQEAFLRVFMAADSFQTHRRFRPWLYTITLNKARDLMRSQGRKPTYQLIPLDVDTAESELWDNLIQDDTTALDNLELKERQEKVRKVVEQLSPHLREILVLAYFQQLSYKEMANVLDIPLGTVKSRLHTAVARFAVCYQRHEQSPERENS